ncbi:MAG: hypothetical protein ACKOX6_12620 [Bdellovibrio sp.]
MQFEDLSRNSELDLYSLSASDSETTLAKDETVTETSSGLEVELHVIKVSM